jgi:hypothetical protein
VSDLLLDALAEEKHAGRFPAALRALNPVARELRLNGLPMIPFLHEVAVMVADALPLCEPGVWQTRSQQRPVLDGLAAFTALAAEQKLPRWLSGEFDQLTAVLPRAETVETATLPARYPASFWAAARQWLIEENFSAARAVSLHEEMTDWAWRHYWQLPSPLRAQYWSAASPPLARLGAWLKELGVTAAVARRLATSWIERIELEQFAETPWTDGQVALLRVLDGLPDLAARLALGRRIFQLQPWDAGLDQSWREWLSGALSSSDSAWRSRGIALVLRGVLLATKGWRPWLKVLSTLDASGLDAAAWNAALGEFDARVPSLAPPTSHAHLRLDAIGRWLESHSAFRESAARWRIWSKPLVFFSRKSWVAPHDRVLLVTAALRCEQNELFAARLRPLWPGLPAALVAVGEKNRLARFISISQAAGYLVPSGTAPALADGLIRTMSSLPGSPDQFDRFLRSLDALLHALPECRAALLNHVAAWPVLPCRLAVENHDAQLRAYRDALKLSEGDITTGLGSSLSRAVLGHLAGVESAGFESIALLIACFHPHLESSWLRLTPLVVPKPAPLPRRLALALVERLLCHGTGSSEFREEVLRQAMICQQSKPELTGPLLALLSP